MFLSIFRILFRSCGKSEEKIISFLVRGCINPKVFACRNCLFNLVIEFWISKSIFFNFLYFFLYLSSPTRLLPLNSYELLSDVFFLFLIYIQLNLKLVFFDFQKFQVFYNLL